MPAPQSTPRIVITAGPTHEPIDAVRYLANRSSGRLGEALTLDALRRRWDVTLLIGPINTRADYTHACVERFTTTSDLQKLLALYAPRCDVLVMSAAVADYRPVQPIAGEKLRRGDGPISLELEPTPDLLAEVAARRRPGQLLVGFALEKRHGMLESARDKLHRKGIDAIVANPLETMGAQTIDAALLWRDGRTQTPAGPLSKADFATWLLDRIEEALPGARTEARTGSPNETC